MRFGRVADASESVRSVDFGLAWNAGAPLPWLVQSEQRALLGFYLDDLVSVGVIEWIGCGGAVLGGLNDEAIQGHPLWERGLKELGSYTGAEVIGSSWIAEWELANRVHPYHRREPFDALRHFILLFHDTTFEVLATGFRCYVAPDEQGVREALAALDDVDPVPFREVFRT